MFHANYGLELKKKRFMCNRTYVFGSHHRIGCGSVDWFEFLSGVKNGAQIYEIGKTKIIIAALQEKKF
jgi:hypothetical protein